MLYKVILDNYHLKDYEQVELYLFSCKIYISDLLEIIIKFYKSCLDSGNTDLYTKHIKR